MDDSSCPLTGVIPNPGSGCVSAAAQWQHLMALVAIRGSYQAQALDLDHRTLPVGEQNRRLAEGNHNTLALMQERVPVDFERDDAGRLVEREA